VLLLALPQVLPLALSQVLPLVLLVALHVLLQRVPVLLMLQAEHWLPTTAAASDLPLLRLLVKPCPW
jgi:hypothetical protein